ncbi:hypothetical protein DPMN_142731 [Dreissena polymorpha]|uniref:Uncharacterized protein n=1 Tax=Dreissena polymorpha TaxID=45954 RepID=A0A9D4JNQ5_DREPO|nr:hypothetical protein DPMN_142731 [Dreissena polymorpha]
MAIKEKVPRSWWPCFQSNRNHFKLVQDIIGKNLQTKFYDDWKVNVASRVHIKKNAPLPGGHVFQPTGIIFRLFQDIIGMNLVTKFLIDWTINMASRVLPIHMRINAPHLGIRIFQANVTIFEIIQYIIKTNHLNIFHED